VCTKRFWNNIQSIIIFFFLGIIYQATGNYDASFYFGGGMFFIGAVMHLTLHLPCVKRCIEKDEPEAVARETYTEDAAESC
jgi:hypothetical protein